MALWKKRNPDLQVSADLASVNTRTKANFKLYLCEVTACGVGRRGPQAALTGQSELAAALHGSTPGGSGQGLTQATVMGRVPSALICLHHESWTMSLTNLRGGSSGPKEILEMGNPSPTNKLQVKSGGFM